MMQSDVKRSDQQTRIHTDRQTRMLYATDASMFEELPMGVAFPSNAEDIRELVNRAGRERFSITARSAGTSLAGQATGNGLIMDVSRHMTQILDLDTELRTVRLQPGVIRDTLNRAAAPGGLLFGPDTATTSRCMLGGMIGNNSCGSFSIKYGTTREHVVEIETVLSDGSTAVFGPLTPEELETKTELNSLEGSIYRGILELVEQHREQILQAYPHPEIIRRNTGYALDRLCTMQPFDPSPDARPFNLAELLCGSEGTLAMTTAATVKLIPMETHRLMLVPHFDTINEAMEATVEIVKQEPAAVELVDDIILDATKGNLEQQKNRFFLAGDPRCILIVEFQGKDPERLADRARAVVEMLAAKGLSTAIPLLGNPPEMDRVWELRKAGLGLLMGLGSNARSPSFCEDTAVRVADLPAYVREFQELLERHGTNCVFYAHASVGELHLRPVIDIKTPEGIEKMKVMAGEVADLVKKYRGSLSGEHGDGRARAPYIEQVLGKEMMPLLRKVKELWDPEYLFNPGMIIDPKPLGEGLRRTPTHDGRRPPETAFSWRREGGFDQALELCNGAGTCRKLPGSGGTMCPSYMATREEKDSTRGRANLFRQLVAGRGADAFASEELHDALALCLSCKACKSECPANVDMARMKAEFMHGWHREKGKKWHELFFGRAGSLYPLAGSMPRLSNYLMRSPVGKELLKLFFRVSPERTLPSFAPETFMEWFEKRSLTSPENSGASLPDRALSPEQRVSTDDVASSPDGVSSPDKVVLLVDHFTNWHDPRVGRAAVLVLEAIGYEVLVPGVIETGRPQISKGLMDEAVRLACRNIDELGSYVNSGYRVVGLEPSELLSLRDEYPDLCREDQREAAERLAQSSFMFEEFLIQGDHPSGELSSLFRDSGREVLLHGHCHAKSLVGDTPTAAVLALAGYQVSNLNAGCCGMAGSFGYEIDKYKVSMQIGEQRLFPGIREKSPDTLVCAPGFSCRHQIIDGTGEAAFHPAELLAQALIQ